MQFFETNDEKVKHTPGPASDDDEAGDDDDTANNDLLEVIINIWNCFKGWNSTLSASLQVLSTTVDNKSRDWPVSQPCPILGVMELNPAVIGPSVGE